MPGKVTVAGLGPGHPDLVTLMAARAMREADILLVRTAKHPAVARMENDGLVWEALDRFYEEKTSFDAVYEAIADYVVGRAERASVCYAVPGDPWVGESTTALVRAKCRDRGIGFEVASGVSFMEPSFALAQFDPSSGMTVLDATCCTPSQLTPWCATMICQVYSRMVASDLKLALLEAYPGEHRVKVITGAGTERPVVADIALYELDHAQTHVDHLTSLYIPPLEGARPGVGPVPGGQLPLLVDIMAKLRSIDGCPWDREQTHASLKPYVIEEAFEVVEAIEEGDVDKLSEELGDLLLQIAFHARIAEEDGNFDIDDVTKGIAAKLIRRHPHVFADVTVADSAAVLANWEAIKRSEKGYEGRKSALDGVPVNLPALMKADKVQSKAARVGFDWEKPDDAMEKVREESDELREAMKSGSADRVEDELGDLLFAVVNVARLSGVDAEFALRRTIDKFQARFRHIEARAAETGRTLEEMTLAEMDALWNEAKLASTTR